ASDVRRRARSAKHHPQAEPRRRGVQGVSRSQGPPGHQRRGSRVMAGCLDGIRVLELARYQAGPRGGMILSDLGTEVIKIERIGGEETRKNPPVVRGQSIYFTVYNRGKKSVCLD